MVERRQAIRLAIGLGFSAMVAGCARQNPGVPVVPAAGTSSICLVRRDWHTDLGLMVDCLPEPMADLMGALFPGGRWFVIGFGDLAYVLASGLALSEGFAALLPGPGALLVTGLRTHPGAAFPDGEVLTLPVSAAGARAAARFAWACFARDSAGIVAPIRDGPYAGSLFFAAAPRYSALYTCNTWTVEGLAAAGFPVDPGGVVFAGQVMAIGAALLARGAVGDPPLAPSQVPA